jgi:hypothetical protein
MKNLAIFILWVSATLATGAEAALTTNQIDEFRDSIKNGCISRGLERGDDKKQVNSFCSCMDKVLRDNLSNDDIEEMARLGRAGKGPGDMPVMKGLLPKLEACKSA